MPFLGRSESKLWWLFGSALAAGFCLGSTVQSQQTFYRWTDERGVVHFSNSGAPATDRAGTTSRVFGDDPVVRGTAPRGGGEVPLVTLDQHPHRKFVRVELESSGTKREILMLVDTGAQTTLIDEELAAELELDRLHDVALVGVTGTAVGWMGQVPSLRLGSHALRDVSVLVGPRSGIHLLGMDVLSALNLSVRQDSLEPD